MNEQQDFYRICLPQETFEDIEIFNSIIAVHPLIKMTIFYFPKNQQLNRKSTYLIR